MTKSPITDLTAQLLIDDALHQRALSLLNAAIDEGFTMMRTGSPAMKLNVLKVLAPAIGRAAQKTEATESDELAKLRDQLEDLTALVTGTTRSA